MSESFWQSATGVSFQLFDLHQVVDSHQAQREHGKVSAEGTAAAAAIRRGWQAHRAASGPDPSVWYHFAGNARESESNSFYWLVNVVRKKNKQHNTV